MRPASPEKATSVLSPAALAKRNLSREAAAEDAELVRRFLRGDESAFNRIVARHREKIYAVVMGVLRNPHDAEEIVQDTFIRAHRGLKNFRGDSSLATWLHHVAVNLARNRYWYFQRRKRHATMSLDCPIGEDGTANLADFMSSEESGPARERMHTEFVELVTACMEQLPAAQREILALRNRLNRSYDEIATALQIEVGTVKSRIARARGQLRSLMAQACPEFSPDAAPADWFEGSPAARTDARTSTISVA